jgi:hypothetical protein
MNCDVATMSLGSYVLGSLDTKERLEVENHIHSCAVCRDVLSDFAGLPGLLGKLDLDDVVTEPVSPPRDMFDRLADQARHDAAARRRHTHLRRLVAAAAALVIAAGAGIGVWQGTSHGSNHRAAFSAVQRGVRMDVDVSNQTSGTALTVTVSGLPKEEHCRLFAYSANGRRELAGSWNSTYSGWAKETGSTSIPRSQLSRLVLVGDSGQQIVTVAV